MQENLPGPTPGQVLGDEFSKKERILAEMPFGQKTMNALKKQKEAATKKIKEIAGEFIGTDSNAKLVGETAQNEINATLETIKQTSQGLYREFAEKSKGLNLNANEFGDKMIADLSKKYNLFDATGNINPHSGRSTMGPEQYAKISNILGSLVKSIKGEGNITPDVIDLYRKSLSNSIKSGKDFDYTDIVLRDALEMFDDAYLNTIKEYKGVYPGLKNNLKILENAKAFWKEYKQSKGALDDLGFTDAAPEKVYDKIFLNSKTYKEFKNVAGEDSAKTLGKQYLWELMKGKSGEKALNAQSALTVIEKKQHVLKEFLSPEEYRSLVNNLKYLVRTGENVNPPQSGIVAMLKSDRKYPEALLLKRELRAGAKYTQRNIPKETPFRAPFEAYKTRSLSQLLGDRVTLPDILGGENENK